MSNPLRKLNTPTTRADKALAEIEWSWEQWQSPNSDVTATDGWRPVDDLATKPLLVDDVIARSQYRVVVSERMPWWRRLFLRR